MTLEDKVQFCTGANFWKTKEMKQYGIASIMVSDGPHGLRCQGEQSDNLGLNNSYPATCFPTAVTSADSWNEKLINEVGKAIAEEALEYGVSVVLGPGCNIKRSPLGGRNFEYFSEDPYLAGKMAASFIQGVQSQGVGTSLKHFACNNQEYKRQNGDSRLDERTFREIYLKSFEMAVKASRPQTVMCSYNRINGVYSSDNKYLLTDILRKEWGFDGLVMTDWGAMADRIKAFKAGCDLNMPGNNDYMVKEVIEAVREGRLDEKDVDACVARILKMVETGLANKREYQFDRDAHHQIAEKMALEGAVLLKNEDAILPLKKDAICILGHMAEDLRYQGSGSSNINPTILKQVKDGLPEGSRLVVTASAVNRAQSFFKTFDAAGVVVDFGSNLKAAERDVNAAMLLDECLPKIPLKMGQAEKHAFLARAGTDSLRIVSELQKLACYCGKRAVATAEDIETVVSRNSVSAVWALTDAFSRRDKTETVRQVRRQLDQGENAIYLAQMLLGTVSELLAVRDALDRGWAAAGRDGVAWQALPEEVAEGLSQGEKDVRKSLVGWRGKKVADYARQWKTRELRLARHHLVKLREELVSSQVPEDFLLATRVLQAMG